MNKDIVNHKNNDDEIKFCMKYYVIIFIRGEKIEKTITKTSRS